MDGPTPNSGLTLQEAAYQRIEEMIVTLALPPGEVVSEASLGRQLGIGTTPIREALQRLSREYLVQILPRRGVVVTAVDVRLQLQVLESRRELDKLIVRSAARRGTVQDRAAFTDLAAAIRAQAISRDRPEFLRLDAALNRLLARVSRSEVAIDLVARLHSVSRRFWFYHQAADTDLGTNIELHAALADAIATGDPAIAATASDALIDHLADFARKVALEI